MKAPAVAALMAAMMVLMGFGGGVMPVAGEKLVTMLAAAGALAVGRPESVEAGRDRGSPGSLSRDALADCTPHGTTPD